MKFPQYIPVSFCLMAGCALLSAQTSPIPQAAPPQATTPAEQAGETMNTGRPARVPDLLNMKGVDRPNPLKDVSIEQRLGAQLPLDATFRDETGRTVKLGDYFGKRPVVLTLVYYDC